MLLGCISISMAIPVAGFSIEDFCVLQSDDVIVIETVLSYY
jgi:hypothetical protein